MSDKAKLLPCPFCGGKAKVSSFPGAHNVWCENQPVSCGNRAMFTVEQWNTRAAPTEDVRLHQSAADTLKQAADTLDAIDRRRIERAERLGLPEDVRAVADEPVHQVRSHGSCCWEDVSGESLESYRCQPEHYEIRKLYRQPQCSEVSPQCSEQLRTQARPVALPERLREVWLFLDGQSELEGCVFGEKPEGRHNFWWRKELRAALEELYPAQ
ncbi:hypothetical protein [Pseudomonas abietaniphila]|uniref:Restriction alleviation protein Lar n=1 Tax=Pseudomonas abietaniphila TaxID=89065 RepID=A0A1G8LMU2_9PSED|nr:hypothetical protein [Pseudomonas abietaniphila]SDI56996.1 hypothetical protein SAMN05216605_114195 [Pseudomonas abietaniphila]